jgi:outer membrane protein assembly factor BamB
VTASGHSDGDVLTLQADGTADWETPAGGGSTALNDLTDVTITTVGTGEVLVYTGAGWENQTLTEAGIAAVSHMHSAMDITSGTLAHEQGGLEADISGISTGDVIAGTGAGTLGLVTASGHSDGDVLTLQADGTADWETPAGGGPM